MTLPISSIVSVTPGVIAPTGTVSILNGLVFSKNTALAAGITAFYSPDDVATKCGANSIEAKIAGIYFSAYTNAQDIPKKLYFYQIPAAPVDKDYSTYLSNAVNAASDWAPFMFATEPDAGAKTQIASWMAAHPNRYWGIVQDSDEAILTAGASTSFGAKTKAASTPGITCLCNTSNNSGTLAAALCLGWAGSVNPYRTSGRSTLMFRNNSAVPAVDITASQAQALLGNGYSFYGSYKSTDSTFSFLNNGAVSGPFAWADSYINQIWMNASFQNDLITLFSNAGQVPYNTVGDSQIATSVQGTIDTALSFGAIQPNVTLSTDEAQAVNSKAGRSISSTLETQGWYLLPGASTASASVRAARGPVSGLFFYMDGESVQSISLASMEVQ